MCAGGHPHGDSLLSLQSASCPGLLPSGTRRYWFSSVRRYLLSEHWRSKSSYTDIKSFHYILNELQQVQFPVMPAQITRRSLSLIAQILNRGETQQIVVGLFINMSVSSFYLQRPQGFLCLLDEESQSPLPAEQMLYKRLSAQLESSPSPGLSLTTKDGNGNPPPKDQGPAFTVNHYARQVRLLQI